MIVCSCRLAAIGICCLNRTEAAVVCIAGANNCLSACTVGGGHELWKVCVAEIACVHHVFCAVKMHSARCNSSAESIIILFDGRCVRRPRAY